MSTEKAELNYWEECVAVAAEECGLSISEEQVRHIGESVKVSHENYRMAFYQPESPYPSRIKELERKLSVEMSKVQCPACNGRGRIVTPGLYHSSDSQCWKCHGEGKLTPDKL